MTLRRCRNAWLVGLLALSALLVVACGGATEPEPAAPAAVQPAATPGPGGMVEQEITAPAKPAPAAPPAASQPAATPVPEATAAPAPVATPLIVPGLEPRPTPSATDPISDLPWAQDGLNELEMQVRDDLAAIAEEFPLVFDVFLGFPWMADEVTVHEADVVRYLLPILRQWTDDEEAVAQELADDPLFAEGITETEAHMIRSTAQVSSLPWVQDGLDGPEVDALLALSGLAEEDPAVSDALLGFPWMADGITREESSIVSWFHEIHEFMLSAGDASLAPAIADSPWLADGISEAEAHAFMDHMTGFWTTSDYQVSTVLAALQAETLTAPEPTPAAADSISNLPWVQDGLSKLEMQVRDDLAAIAEEYPLVFDVFLGFPWMADGITVHEADAVRYLLPILRQWTDDSEAMAHELADDPWLADGISEAEAHMIRSTAQVSSLPWVQDGLDGPELDAWDALLGLAEAEPAVADALLGFAWMADGITEAERAIVYRIYQDIEYALRSRAAPLAPAIADSPWLADGISEAEAHAFTDIGFHSTPDAYLYAILSALRAETLTASTPAPTATPPPAASGATAPALRDSPIAPELAALGDNLLWVAHFDNATQGWSVYDASGAFSVDELPTRNTINPASLTPIAELAPGDIYYLKVRENQEVVLNGLARPFTAGLNQIVW